MAGGTLFRAVVGRGGGRLRSLAGCCRLITARTTHRAAQEFGLVTADAAAKIATGAAFATTAAAAAFRATTFWATTLGPRNSFGAAGRFSHRLDTHRLLTRNITRHLRARRIVTAHLVAFVALVASIATMAALARLAALVIAT